MEDSSPLTSASISNKIIRFGYKTEGTLHKINTTANPFLWIQYSYSETLQNGIFSLYAKGYFVHMNTGTGNIIEGSQRMKTEKKKYL